MIYDACGWCDTCEAIRLRRGAGVCGSCGEGLQENQSEGARSRMLAHTDRWRVVMRSGLVLAQPHPPATPSRAWTQGEDWVARTLADHGTDVRVVLQPGEVACSCARNGGAT